MKDANGDPIYPGDHMKGECSMCNAAHDGAVEDVGDDWFSLRTPGGRVVLYKGVHVEGLAPVTIPNVALFAKAYQIADRMVGGEVCFALRRENAYWVAEFQEIEDGSITSPCFLSRTGSQPEIAIRLLVEDLRQVAEAKANKLVEEAKSLRFDP